MAVPLAAQDSNASQPETGHITGTVTDVNNDVLSGATVVLEGPALKDPRTVVSNDNGFFEFNDLEPGTYHVTVSAKGFANWTSPAVILNPGQYVILTGSKLKIAEAADHGRCGLFLRGDRHRAGQDRGEATRFRHHPQFLRRL